MDRHLCVKQDCFVSSLHGFHQLFTLHKITRKHIINLTTFWDLEGFRVTRQQAAKPIPALGVLA